MASQGFPGTHTTTTTVTSSTTKVRPALRFDPSYIRTIPGILKIAQLVDNFTGFICAQVSVCSWCSHSTWFTFVSTCGFWVTLILLLFYLFHVIERLHVVPWLLSEFVYCALWTLFYFTAAIVMAVKGGQDAAYGAAAFFGFVGMALYGADAFFKFKGWRSGELAQGERTVTTTVSQTASPVSPTYPAY